MFDICVLNPSLQDDVGKHIASALAWDHALKIAYPEPIAADVDRFLMTLLLTQGHDNISRFRIVKRMWDRFYSKALQSVPSAAASINAANKAMRLKSKRDFLDCDLLHLACFGWFGGDVLVLTCDPPQTILNRLAVYKGMVAAVPTELSRDELPKIRDGVVARCESTGEITHIFPVQRVPTIV